ncbi:bifunctional 3-(3-hydroxy-phenyl)propionate/3-hydroxycinnamic acid hydroxylase [Sphingomonas mollis]|uniref:Bifunctional 3-(3-hydroxy-phenyl)propionate/3-hydroxycinnamic acid hydroxylase n=1 Tax=Sphingomonas mollis TaxID=2795726 RepID=A0ABS0XPE9_9SPHN|nr:bifunctional 3-(3-hydroxy-phenyl)propionate/3-hydroxycinnamic acid hydroxylase [Sphingomonas sp. BT553]MBJ6121625.1 bifunctional 3-(3-hydroxy-phenyl)propionate/3-hydroxycinnamic acid hydroxylase [Sphingomonas sp. BT553]
MYDVAVVGCGPVGALAANLAATAGLSVLVIDREATPHPLPRAVHLDHEMMRLFQSVRLAEAIAPTMRETEGHLHVGADHGVIRYMGTAGRPKPFGWANDYFFYQPELEALLRDGLARFDSVEVSFGTELDAFDQDDEGVTLHLRRNGGNDTVRARWMIACDGARSVVRKDLGIRLDDLDFEEPWLVVDAEVDGAVRFPDVWGVPDAADLQQLSVMMCDPRRPATVVPGRGRIRRWEFMLLPGETDAAMMAPDAVAALLAPYLDGVPHRLLRATTYRFHGLIAERWRQGRIFLAGDAAHQTPPFFGQGMCHGMRDAANLIWKLALVTRGDADVALLDTYQPERDPHVRHVVTAAVEAGRYICELDPGRAAIRDATMRARAVSGVATTAADLIPAYATGAVATGTSGAGERFVQPWVDRDGVRVLMDDVTGQGWRLFAADADAAVQARAACASIAVLDVTVIDIADLSDDGTLAAWLDTRGVRFVLVRPDAYVFGTATTDVDALVAQARAALHLHHDAPAPIFQGDR